MNYSNWDACIDQLINQYGDDLIENIDNKKDEIAEVILDALIKTIKDNEKPKDIKNIQDLAKLLNGNEYYNELDNPYDINVEELCKKNKWIILFPYSDDNLEVRGYIDDEIPAWDGINVILYKKGDFYPNDEYNETFKKASENMIIGVDDESFYENEIKNGKLGVNIQWCSNESYIWYITTEYPNVAYFNIVDDDDEVGQTWARCCIIDCSNIL